MSDQRCDVHFTFDLRPEKALPPGDAGEGANNAMQRSYARASCPPLHEGLKVRSADEVRAKPNWASKASHAIMIFATGRPTACLCIDQTIRHRISASWIGVNCRRRC